LELITLLDHLSLPSVEIGTDYPSWASELTTGRGYELITLRDHLSLPPVEVGTDYPSLPSELTTARGLN